MRKYLFVGGKADGEMREVDIDYQPVVVSIMEGLNPDWVFNPADFKELSIGMSRQIYTPRKWRTNGRDFVIFGLEEIGDEQIMECMIKYYTVGLEKTQDSDKLRNLLWKSLQLMNDACSNIEVSSVRRRIWDLTNDIYKYFTKWRKNITETSSQS